MLKHGLTKTHRREYNSWLGARYRCTSTKHPKWDDYGGRGIQMCSRWANSFPDFLADMGDRPDGTELDRIDNDGHYEPGNCRWVSKSENARNKYRSNPKPKPRRIPKKPNGTDRARLAKLDRIDARYADRLKRAKQRVATIEAEIAATKQPIIEGIRPEFRPS